LVGTVAPRGPSNVVAAWRSEVLSTARTRVGGRRRQDIEEEYNRGGASSSRLTVEPLTPLTSIAGSRIAGFRSPTMFGNFATNGQIRGEFEDNSRQHQSGGGFEEATHVTKDRQPDEDA